MKNIKLYTDGSFNGTNYGWGYVITSNNMPITINKGVGTNQEATSMYQIMGELEAVMQGVLKCHELGFNKITVCYDLVNIKHWAVGEWKRNNKFTQYYYTFMQQLMKNIDIEWVKIKAHSGIKYNELADGLAKIALREDDILNK